MNLRSLDPQPSALPTKLHPDNGYSIPYLNIAERYDIILIMKALKLNHAFAHLLVDGAENATWRINDDKDLHVNDTVTLIDKVDPIKPETWTRVGIGQIVSILEKQLGSVTQHDILIGEKLLPIKELLEKYRGYYGQQVSEDTPVKIVKFVFHKDATSNTDVKKAMISKEYKLYTDGGSRGNPGPSACAFVLMDMDDNVIKRNGLFLGVTTNNQAEYQSLKMGLEASLRAKASVVHVYMDSTLVVNQMKGIYNVKNRDLIPVNASVQDIVARLPKVTFTYIPREYNRLADSLVNEILDSQQLPSSKRTQ